MITASAPRLFRRALLAFALVVTIVAMWWAPLSLSAISNTIVISQV